MTAPHAEQSASVMTMYNKGEELFCRSIPGVLQNIALTCKRDSGKNVVVCMVSDALPVQIIFCLKEKDQRKTKSHLHSSSTGLTARSLQPLDVNTMPGPTSIHSFDLNLNVGGACGEIVTLKEEYETNMIISPLVAAWNPEENILDKPLESVFGYITVLLSALCLSSTSLCKTIQRVKDPYRCVSRGHNRALHTYT